MSEQNKKPLPRDRGKPDVSVGPGKDFPNMATAEAAMTGKNITIYPPKERPPR